jgi:hypothetical protein
MHVASAILLDLGLDVSPVLLEPTIEVYLIIVISYKHN